MVSWLQQDIEQFSQGVETIIGERGINISGGQKTRISLARAIYSDADIYLLDDPLSAVDSNMAYDIFNNWINGFLKHKCRVLVTHQIQFLKKVQNILLIENGRIKAQGSFDEIKNYNVNFDSILQTFRQGTLIKNKDEEQSSERIQRKDSIKNISNEEFSKSNQKEPTNKSEIANDTNKNISINKNKSSLYDWYNIIQYGFGITGAIFLILLVIWSSSFGLFSNYSLKELARDHENKNSNFKYFIYSTFLFLLFCFLRSFWIGIMFLYSSNQIHSKMTWKLLRAPVRYFDWTPIGEIMARFSQDISSLDNIIPGNLDFAMSFTFRSVVSLALIIYVIPWNIIGVILIWRLIDYFRRKHVSAIVNTQKLYAGSKGPINTKYSSAIDGIMTIRAYRQQKYFESEFLEAVDHNSSARFTFHGVLRWLYMRLDICSLLIWFLNLLITIMMKCYWTGFDKTLTSLTFQSMMEISFCLSISVKMSSELKGITENCHRAIKIAEMETEDELTKLTDSPSWPETNDIEFKSVFMKYRDNYDHVLKDLSFKIESGEKVGIIGRSGAGKSSILQAIFRLIEIEQNWQITIGGQDIKTLGLHSLRKHISFIPQSPFLIWDSIRKNLDPFNEFSDNQIWTALKSVQLSKLIKDFPEGLETNIGEEHTFSTGQKQLLCLARAILRNNKIVILDEPTANVDIETDSIIQQNIRESFKDWTTITIAHRLASIVDNDKILVMNNGSLQTQGNPKNLLMTLNFNNE